MSGRQTPGNEEHSLRKVCTRNVARKVISNVDVFAELNLIQRALYTDPYDQSLWFYHQCLMDNLEPRAPIISIISDLTSEEILAYLGSEIEKILEMQDGAEDCKWIYQSLLQLSKLYKKLSHRWPAQEDQIRNWIVELQKVDVIRSGRWADLEKELQLNSSA